VDEPRCIKVSRRIDAPAGFIFALLADPARHEVIDGSGTVRSPGSSQMLTAEGQRFRMHMHREDRGGAYETDNIVTTFRPDRALGWATTYPDQEPLGYSHTFLLEPDGVDRTVVTQIYDWSGVTDPDLLHLFPRISADDLATTLNRLAEALR
jgi:hypothetical protein